jgi:hypothetical protein
MPIPFDCPECMKSLQLPEGLAGQKTSCPACGTVFRVPKSTSGEKPAEPTAPPAPTPAPAPAAVQSARPARSAAARPAVPVARPAPGAPPPPVLPLSPAAIRPQPTAVAAPVARAVTPRPAVPALPDPEAEGEGGGAGGVLLALLPIAVLGLGLLVVVGHDFVLKGGEAPPPVLTPEDTTGLLDPNPRIAFQFHNREETVDLEMVKPGEGGVKPGTGSAATGRSIVAVWDPSMRFGLVMLNEADPSSRSQPKRLTFEERGTTNNTCVRLDGFEYLFGERPFHRKDDGEVVGPDWPGRWLQRENKDLGNDAGGRTRQGVQSVWSYDAQHVLVTQTVEIVPGAQSRLLDTCLVRYKLENQDTQPHKLGIRFLLDTYIGANDGVPFTIPGQTQLCDTMLDFPRPADVPDFIQALEREDLRHPGTIAHLQLRLGGKMEPPDRVTLGAWPNPQLGRMDRRAKQEKTLWDVPLLSMKTMTTLTPPGPADSAVTIYWDEKEVPAGGSREMGFAYGLGNVSSGEGGGKLALTTGGSFTPGGEFTLTAYVSNPQPNQTVTLTLPDGFRLVEGDLSRPVPPLPAGSASRNSPVTWRIRAASREGQFTLKVLSSTGVSQSEGVRIKANRLFD